MSNTGYLYVLANSAMPGLVKVGKTTRTPSERAQELSGVTGIPIPFIVVYEQLFHDCHAAEEFVHTLLGQQGFRVSENREFFNAPPTEIIRAIIKAPGAINSDVGHVGSINTIIPKPLNVAPVAPGCHIEVPSSETPPYFDLTLQALKYMNGSDDYLQDFGKSLKLFQQAAKLGSALSYYYLGMMHEEGQGTPVDTDRAREYYEEGARRGNTQCYWSIGRIYLLAGLLSNAEKCFAKFIQQACVPTPDTLEPTVFHKSNYYDCHQFLRISLIDGSPIPPSLSAYIQEHRGAILEVARGYYQRDSRDSYRRVVQYLEGIGSS